jgi:hypothetical protein
MEMNEPGARIVQGNAQPVRAIVATMGAEHLAAIQSALEELEAEEAQNGKGRPPKYFARFSLSEQEPWIEVVLARTTVVNLWHPHDDDPREVLEESGIALPSPFEVIEDANPSCTFSIPRIPVAALSRFVEDLFLKLYGAAPDYPLEIEMCAFE